MSSNNTQPTTETTTLTVQDSDALPKAPEAVSSGWTSMVPMILIFAVFYFLLIRPQDKRRKAQAELVSGVKKGEEVLTSSGIMGVVTKINDSDNTILVEVAKGIEIKMLKNAVTDITSRAKKEEPAKAIDKKKVEKKAKK